VHANQHPEVDDAAPTLARPLRILLISQWFDPEPTFKGQLFAQELKRQGHDVRVLTGFPNYPGGKVYDGYRIRLFQREVVDGIPILRVPLYPSHDGSGLRRAINYLSFAATATLGALLTKRPDVAYVYHPPATVGLPAMALKLFKGVPFVYDVQDLWPDTLAATGMLNRRSLLALVGRVMTGVYRAASSVVVLSEGFRAALVGRSVPEGQIHVIPNWADEKQINLAQPPASRARELGFDGKFTVTFAGNMGKGQALETVLDAAEILRERGDIRFLLVGGGIESESLKRHAVERELDNVVFLPRRPISEIGEILALSDALLVHLGDDPLFAITIPSKTQAYLMAGRPILMGVRGDASRIIEQTSAGISFEPENSADLASAVRALTNLSEPELRLMGERGQAFYREHMSLAVGARSFSRVLRTASLVRPYTAAGKRAMDLIVSGTALVLLSAPMGVVALLIRRKLGSPVLFRQERPGRYGKPFRMYKFRTMSDDRNEHGELLPDRSRLTSFGAALRSTSIDELPELINVWRGEMSLVGPRPLLMRYTEYFTEEERLRFIVRPGITGAAQVDGRNTASWNKRLALDVQYVGRLSIVNDVKILAQTIARVFRRSGVVVDPESTMLNLDDERRIANPG
jgi:lipopolysaccharide/colanic/teichoic acid biosynthesis glycosyltransferase